MAGISDDHTASDSPSEWPFITAAIELVARYMPQGAAQEAAQEFLLIELHAKRIRYRYHGQAKCEGWEFPLTYVWLRHDKLITHEITLDATVIRRGITLVRAKPPPPMRRRKGFTRLNPGARDSEERYVFDPHGRTTVTRLELVQLHRGDILRRLQERGLLPMQQELSLPATAPNKLAEPTIAPAKKWQPEEGLKWLDEAMKNHPRRKEGEKEESKNAWARRLYDKMKVDFEDRIPWNGWESLRRRMNS